MEFILVNRVLIAIISLILIFSSGCVGFRPGWLHENSFTVVDGERLPGTFDDDGNFIPENPDETLPEDVRALIVDEIRDGF